MKENILKEWFLNKNSVTFIIIQIFVYLFYIPIYPGMCKSFPGE